jgi:cytidyltransferase-like protein
MKTVLTFGVYDMLHIGHILLFKKAKELGDKLIVAVQDGDYILKYKPDTKMVYTTEERLYMVSTIKYVDEVVVYKDVDKDIKNIDFDNYAESIPAFVTIIIMPLAYSISDGILLGMISYVVLNVLCGNYKRITPTMYILAVLFILKYIFI